MSNLWLTISCCTFLSLLSEENWFVVCARCNSGFVNVCARSLARSIARLRYNISRLSGGGEMVGVVVVISHARAWFGLFSAPFSVQWCADLLPRFSIVVACFGISMDRFESWSSVFYCKRFCYCRRFVAFVYIIFFRLLIMVLYAHEHMSVRARASEHVRARGYTTEPLSQSIPIAYDRFGIFTMHFVRIL